MTDRYDPRRRSTAKLDSLRTAAEKRLDEELMVHKLYLDLARWERGER